MGVENKQRTILGYADGKPLTVDAAELRDAIAAAQKDYGKNDLFDGYQELKPPTKNMPIHNWELRADEG